MNTSVPLLERLQALADRCPYNTWLGVRFVTVGDGSVEVSIPWRAEMIGIPVPPTIHGGILAGIVDFAASNAIATKFGQAVPTVDLRIDYHRVAKSGDLLAKGKVIRAGRTLATAEAEVYDCEGTLVASGRGTFYSAKIAARAAGK